MSYKTILIHANNERNLPRLLEAATALASRDRSHLIGLSAVPPVFIPPATDMIAAVPGMIETHRDAYRIEEARMKALFETATQDTASPGSFTAEWRSVDTGIHQTVFDVIVPAARTADLVVASQADPKWLSTGMMDIADQLATDSARPVLVIPNVPRKPFAAKRILIAWNGRREATRAVFDAVPILAHADEVRVLWLDPQASSESGDLPTADLCAALARHGVKCEGAIGSTTNMAAGETLMFEAAKFGWDLVVMGCYGHSRLREFILGGATRDVLQKMTVPVLMSH